MLTAYAQAMQEVATHFPDDADVQVLTAEAMMNTNAWKLWQLDGTPAPGTEAIVARLAAVLASPHPEKAVVAAERLRGMMPAAGHLEHMPAHIMQRVGRYEEAAEANRKTVGLCTDWLSPCVLKPVMTKQPLYRIGLAKRGKMPIRPSRHQRSEESPKATNSRLGSA